MEYIEISKSDTQVIRWLHSGTNKDSGDFGRRSLEAMSIEDDIAVVADGFTLRIVSTPEPLKEFKGKLVRLDKPPRVAGDVVKTDVIEDSKFPDWREVIPSGKPTYQITLSGGKLAAIISEMGAVTLEFHSPSQPVIIKSEDRYALLMPMHLDDVTFFDPINQPESDKESK